MEEEEVDNEGKNVENKPNNNNNNEKDNKQQ